MKYYLIPISFPLFSGDNHKDEIDKGKTLRFLGVIQGQKLCDEVTWSKKPKKKKIVVIVEISFSPGKQKKL